MPSFTRMVAEQRLKMVAKAATTDAGGGPGKAEVRAYRRSRSNEEVDIAAGRVTSV